MKFLLAFFLIFSTVAANANSHHNNQKICTVLISNNNKFTNFKEIQKDTTCTIAFKTKALEAPPITIESSEIIVMQKSFADRVSQSEIFKAKNGDYTLDVDTDFTEPQSSLETMKIDIKQFTGQNQVLIGIKTLYFQANPFQLWPNKKSRLSAIKKYLTKKGFVFNCIYAITGTKQMSAEIRGCVPVSNNKNDLSLRDFEALILGIRFPG